jgi:hypothetical protein
MYYRARFYDPQLGRFISEDPLQFKGRNRNWYEYVQNDPVDRIDPSGRVGVISDPASVLDPRKWHRWLATGDPDASDFVYEEALRGGGRWFKCNSPLRGMFVFGGFETHGPGSDWEGMGLAGWNFDGDDVYVGGLAATGQEWFMGGSEYIHPIIGGEGGHLRNIVLVDPGVRIGGYVDDKSDYGFFTYDDDQHPLFYGAGIDTDFSKFRNYIHSWSPRRDCPCGH